MKHKTTRIALVSFIIIVTATTLVGYAYNWPPETPDFQLTWDTESDWMPSIAQARDGKVWVVWYTYRTGNEEIFYKIYDASNVHPWSSDTQLTNNTNIDIAPAIMQAKDGKIWVVWSSNRSGNYDLWYKVYDGVSWSSDTQLTTDPYQDRFPSIVQVLNGTIWVVWSTNRKGNFDPYYKTSTNYGTTWSSEKCIFPQPPTPGDDLAPSITQVSNGDIWVAWENNYNIYYRIYKSTTWKWDTAVNPVTNDQPPNINSHPSLMQASDGKTWVVWSSNSTLGNFEIVYKRHDGYMWESEVTRLTQTLEDDKMPSIMQANDQAIWIVWSSFRAGGGSYDIYYKTTAMLQLHDVAIVSITSYTTKANRGQTVSIEVVAQNLGTNAENFEVQCYSGLTLIGSEQESLLSGRVCPIIFNWNTTGVASGTYTISAEASHVSGETKTADNAFTDGTVQIKVLGDINGDDHVNGLDAGILTYDIWSIPGDPRWNNGRSDLNNDGIVDIEDAGIIVINFEG